MQFNSILYGDAFDLIRDLPDHSVDLIFTSPPYAMQRKNSYGGVPAEQYVAWFMPLATELQRVLKPTGSFVLNIKEHCKNGERHTYVLELILALRQAGWLWCEEYIWHKKNAFPGYWPNRLRDAWERLLHFTVQRKFAMYQDAVKQPMKPSTTRRFARLSERDQHRNWSGSGSGLSVCNASWDGKTIVLPDNVLYVAPETSNRAHSAVMPKALPEFFIRLLTAEDDLVLDPFAGSGTTCKVAASLGRQYLGFEIIQPERIEGPISVDDF